MPPAVLNGSCEQALPAQVQVLAPPTAEVLYEQHQGLVTSIVDRFLSSRREAVSRITSLERDDLLQEGRIGLLQAARRFDPARGAFESFASRRILGAVLSALREEGETASTCSSADADALCEPSHDSLAEARVTLQQLLPQLPEREQDAIQLHHLCGYSKLAVAEKLGVSERHAGRIIDEAMHKLQRLADA